MEKIKIVLTYDALKVVLTLYESIEAKPKWQHRPNKVLYSVLRELQVKLQKKAIDKYNTTKPFSFDLKIYQADALERILRYGSEWVQDGYGASVMRRLADSLNQKLA